MLSIIAGKTIANFSPAFPRPAPRCGLCPTPPLPSAAGSPPPSPTRTSMSNQRRWCERLLGAVGAFFWVDKEDAIDAVTAISGSGPAYAFALTEALAAAAEKLGLPTKLSMSLARGTVEGAAELMRRESARLCPKPCVGTSPPRAAPPPPPSRSFRLLTGSTTSWQGRRPQRSLARPRWRVSRFLGGGRPSAYIGEIGYGETPWRPDRKARANHRRPTLAARSSTLSWSSRPNGASRTSRCAIFPKRPASLSPTSGTLSLPRAPCLPDSRAASIASFSSRTMASFLKRTRVSDCSTS